MLLEKVFIILVVQTCMGVTYQMDDLEYYRMPPLYGMDSNYDGCLKESGGVYCVAKFSLHGDPENVLINIIRQYSQNEMKHYNYSNIERAVCVSKSCKYFIQNKTLDSLADLNTTLEECINDTIWREYGLEAKLTHVYYCDKHGDEMLVDLWDWIFAAVLISLLTLNLIGSVYDVWHEKNHRPGNSYLLSFSMFKNWKQLTAINFNPKYDRLRGIHGLKSIATFFVAIAHVMWLVGSGFMDNPRDFEMAHHRFHYQVIFSGMVIVQIFFVISGCLLAFYLRVMSETKRLTWNIIPKILFLRWARLTPANAITVLFTATWFRHLGSGPLWNMYVTNVVASCRNHWWQHLFYFHNYVREDKFCAIQTWHVSAELQLFAVGLLVYMASASRGRYPALALLGLVGMVGPALHVWLQDLDALVLHRPQFYRTLENETFRSMHILGHNNISCHAIGMAIGLISYYCVKNKIEFPNSKLLKYLTWCVPLGVIGLSYSGILFYVDGERPHVQIRMTYAAIQRPALGVMIALLILNLVLKFESVIRGVLEWRGWLVTSRLSYSVYLLHVNFIHILQGTRTQLGHVSFFYVIVNYFGVVSMSFMASIPFYLLLEAPVSSITKVFIEESSKEKEKKT